MPAPPGRKQWSQIARATFKRRDYLITLGLAKRRKTKKQDELAEDPSEDTP